MFRAHLPTLAGLFEKHVDSAPARPAIIFDTHEWSYAELDVRANRLAAHLIDRGVRPGAFVGVCTDRRSDMVLATLAALKCGAVCVPLDVSYPAERLAWMAQDAVLDLVVTRQPHDKLLPWDATPVVRLDGDAELIAACTGERPGRQSAAQPACMMYTSGSTGRPKGVLTTQKAVIRLVVDTCYLRLTPEGRVGFGGNLSFDASVLEIWMGLLNGACLVAIDREVMISPRHLKEFVQKQRLSTVFVTTSLFNEVIRNEPSAFATVPQLIIGGEAADPGSVRAAREHLPAGGRLLSGYGPTEASTFSAVYDTAALPAEADAVPIGTEIDQTRLYVLDERLEPVPDGTPGELYIGGTGLSYGYWRRPDRTAASFLPDPFAGGGARMYRSGDRATRRPDGVLEFGGRLDGQLKIRGFRIELGEVEEALRAHPAVVAAVATVREDRPGDRRLVGYVVPAEQTADEAADELTDEATGELSYAVREFVRGRLPAQLVPSSLVVLDRIPLTPNGKADRAALPAPSARAAADGARAARDSVEEVIAGMWAEALGVDEVATDRNFFDLGGHSLIATQVVARIRETYGIELPMRLMFEGRTVAQLAEAVRQAQGDGEAPAMAAAVPRRADPTRGLPSFGEEQFLFLDELKPGNTAYNNAFAYRLRGPLDTEALRRALTALAARHDALRTSFDSSGETRLAVVADEVRLELRTAKAHRPEDEAGLRSTLDEEAYRPFDLGSAPLLRALLVPLGEDDHVLQLTVHEIIADAGSLRILFEDLSALYAGRPLPAEPPLSYRDFAEWQRRRLEGAGAAGAPGGTTGSGDGDLAGQMAYWREQLAGAPDLLPLPTDRPRPAVQSFRGATHHFTLPAELVTDLDALAREHEASLFMVLLSGVKAVLHRYTGIDDLVVGSPVAGRLRPELDRVVGFLVNTLALRTSLGGDPTFAELLGRVRETSLSAFTHQEVPFERLTAELAPSRSLSHSPLVQVLFSLHTMPGEGLDLPGVEREPLPSGFSATQFDLTFTLERRPDGSIAGAVIYGTDLFDEQSIDRLTGHLTTLVRGAVSAPRTPLSALPLLTAPEHEELRRLNATAKDLAPDAPRLLHEVVEEQARRTPEATALVHEGDRLSYAELNTRANRLARHLTSLGVGPERIVALSLERGLDVPVAILATLKAGGAYLPVDPTYPRERREFMLSHSKAAVVLSGELPDTRELPGDDLHTPVDPRHPAYVIYTSGSTGRPKGVVIPHAGVVNLITDPHYDALVPRGCRAAVWASFSFDASVYAMFPALARGAEVHLAPDRARTTPEDHLDWLVEHRIESTFLAPYMVPEAARRSGLELRGISVGAEAVSVEAYRRLAGRLRQDCLVVNAYGPTEASVSASMYAVPVPLPEELTEAKSLPIGRALQNVRLHVLDAAGIPVPAGVTGELWIAGDGLARGYLGDPAQTADRFRPDPLGPPGSRMYRTGDLAYRRADGDLVFAGRADKQIKLNGLRVEPGEIEAVAERHPAVSAAHVRVRDGGLVAYVAVPDADGFDLDGLRAFLAETLPQSLVPGRFVVLPELPLSPNGKLDADRLPDPAQPSATRGRAPRTGTERLVAELLGELLDIRELTVEDKFFELGGDSLKAARLARRLSKARALPVPTLLPLVLRPGTIGDLAAAVDTALATATASAGQDRPSSGVAPLRPAARRTLAELLDEDRAEES
ncbi:non-ribosomal peptide synthetase [Streptomyces sp. KN37]|uniref:non-ribosomal peptide synthetase n=1 Tax=Streptomyces sp. KN37 TaxID=3090667 RepID=UPI002A764344|nr:non-ribosomal peptide synthetase [Streptomyces sp. KN37]WPO76489.1 amino acid adenylation domain-containing protein [Streptomyces sp. KN37]